MKAVVWHGGTEFAIEDLPDPVPGPGETIVRVDTAAVCGTDVHITQGLFPQMPPKVLGHEFSGTIVSVGEDVSRDRVGQRVACDHSSYCGECENCRTWQIARCSNAVASSGAYAEYAMVPDQSAHLVPEGLDIELASLTEPASCCLSAVEKLALTEGATVLVLGAGIIGLMTTAFLKTHGVATVIVSEPVVERREMSRQFGADILNNPQSEDLEQVGRDATGGRGVHAAVEAVGKPEMVSRCIDLTRPAGEVLMLGVNPSGSTLPADLYDFHYREIRLIPSFGRGNNFARTLTLLPSLSMEGVISARFPLEQTPQAIELSGQGLGVKVVVKPGMSVE